jgi:hypothetical protein
MAKFDEPQNASRRRAEEVLSRKKPEAERLSAGEKERRAFDEKTERLRNMRIAKETADKAEAAAHPTQRTPKGPRRGQ